jgi:putative signal transducing protein
VCERPTSTIYDKTVGDDLVVVDVVATESEAEMLCSLLRSAGLRCMERVTDRGAAAFEGLPTGGPHEVLVRAEDVDAARQILQTR